MATLSEKIVQILTESQSSAHSHQKLLKSLQALHDQHADELEAFFAAYFKPFSNALVVFKREPTVQRVIEFTAKFAISTASSPPPEKSDSSTSGSGEAGQTHETFY